MKLSIAILVTATLITAVFLLPANAQKNKTTEQFAATVTAVGGAASGASAPIDIWIDEFTSNEEVVTLANLLAEKGTEALRRAMEKKEVGRISVSNAPSAPIAVARSLTDGKNRIVRLFIARNVLFLERMAITRSQDYPFSIIELQLNDKGQGQGVAMAAAKMRFDAKNKQFIVESLGHGTDVLKLVNVRKF